MIVFVALNLIGGVFVITAFRNGLHYGVKVRAPHALVMTLLFKSGSPIASNLASIVKV
jgi:peroxisomal membrane protein 4